MDPLKIALYKLGGALAAYKEMMRVLQSGEAAQIENRVEHAQWTLARQHTILELIASVNHALDGKKDRDEVLGTVIEFLDSMTPDDVG